MDKATGKPVPCRVHLKDANGKAQKADKLPFWNDHFVCPGEVALDLPPGKYTVEIERGPEYSLSRRLVHARSRRGRRSSPSS